MDTVVAGKSIVLPVAGSCVLHNSFFVPATVAFSFHGDEAFFAKPRGFTVVP